MISKGQLKQYHVEKVPLHVLELDYIQYIVLRHIYADHDGIAFKGGTSLRIAHGLNRFSEDLDFNLIKGDPQKMLESAVEGLERTGIPARVGSFQERKNVYLATLRFQGPIYAGTPSSEGSMEMELSKYGILLEPIWLTVVSPYPDIGTFMLRSMAPEEILAEKVRSLLQRKKPRDLYDIWYLLMKGVILKEDLLYKKMEQVGLDPMGPPQIFRNYEVTESEWNRDLGNLMTRVPDLRTTTSEIEERLFQ
jgi:predicted nucleotidyltransferase component of viral defense system